MARRRRARAAAAAGVCVPSNHCCLPDLGCAGLPRAGAASLRTTGRGPSARDVSATGARTAAAEFERRGLSAPHDDATIDSEKPDERGLEDDADALWTAVCEALEVQNGAPENLCVHCYGRTVWARTDTCIKCGLGLQTLQKVEGDNPARVEDRKTPQPRP